MTKASHNPFTTLQKTLIAGGFAVALSSALFLLDVRGDTQIASTFTPPGLEDGLVGHWTFDGNDMFQNVADRSGNGNHGVLVNHTSTTTTSGVLGQGYDFGTVDEGKYIDIPSLGTATYDLYTISAWYKTNLTTLLDDHNIVMAGNWSGGEEWIVFTVTDDGGEVGNVRLQSRSGSTAVTLYSNGASVIDGEWHHLVVQRTATDYLIYIDGIAAGITPDPEPSETIDPPTNVFAIGDDPDADSEQVTGVLDDVRIYNRALSAAEIKQLYDLGATTKVATTPEPPPLSGAAGGLVGHWTFDGKDMLQNVADRSGNGNHGELGQIATTTSSGRIGQALDFKGTSDDWVDVGSDTALAFKQNDDWTASMWFKARDFFADDGALLSRSSTGVSAHFFLRIDRGTTPQELEVRTFDETTVSLTSGNIIYPDTWYFVAVSNSGGTLRMRVYNDSGLIANITDSHDGDHVNVNTFTTQFGRGRGAQDPFNGLLDDVRIYSRALSADEIKQLYDLGATTKIATTPASAGLSDAGGGLVGHWTFDGKDMLQNVADRSGNGNHGALQGQTSTTTTEGVLGQALEFDGSDDYIQTGLDLKAENSFTVSVWLKADQTGDEVRNMVVWQGVSTGNGGGAEQEFSLSIGERLTSNGTFNALWTDMEGDASGDIQLSATGFTDTVNWHHFAVVYSDLDGASPTGRLYLDGVFVTSGSASAAIDRSAWDTDLRIGRPGADQRYMDGSIDDVRIYNRALSANEIKQLYQMGR